MATSSLISINSTLKKTVCIVELYCNTQHLRCAYLSIFFGVPHSELSCHSNVVIDDQNMPKFPPPTSAPHIYMYKLLMYVQESKSQKQRLSSFESRWTGFDRLGRAPSD